MLVSMSDVYIYLNSYSQLLVVKGSGYQYSKPHHAVASSLYSFSVDFELLVSRQFHWSLCRHHAHLIFYRLLYTLH